MKLSALGVAAFALAAACLWASAGARRVQAAHLVNADLESDADANGVPDGWGRLGAPVYDRSGGESASGLAAARVNLTNLFYQRFTPIPGMHYTVGGRFRSDVAEGAARILVQWEAGGQFLSAQSPPWLWLLGVYSRAYGSVLAPFSADEGVFFPRSPNNGFWIWEDDLEVLGEDVENGGFELASGAPQQPSHWELLGAPLYDAGGSEAHSGLGAIGLAEGDEARQRLGVCPEQKRGVLTFWARGETRGDRGAVRLEAEDFEGHSLGAETFAFATDLAYERHVVEVPRAPGAALAQVALSAEGAGRVWIDDAAVCWTAAAPNPFSPNEDGLQDETVISFYLPDDHTASASIERPDGTPLRALLTGQALGRGVAQVAWDGLDDGGQPAPEGEAVFRLETHSPRLGDLTTTHALRLQRSRFYSVAPPRYDDWFPIGGWELWAWNSGSPERFRLLDELAANGYDAAVAINLPQDRWGELLQAAERSGLRIILHAQETEAEIRRVGPYHALDEEATRAAADSLAGAHGASAALLGYYLCDEPNAAQAPAAGQAQRIFVQADPAHSGFSALAHSGSEAQIAATLGMPALLFDFYPLGVCSAARPASFDEFIAVHRGAAAVARSLGKPLWAFMQTYGWADSMRRPTPGEVRAQAYILIALGARGLFHFLLDSIGVVSGLWDKQFELTPLGQAVGRLNREIASLRSALLDLTPSGESVLVEEGSVVAEPFHDSSGRLWLIVAATEAEHAVAARIRIAGFSATRIADAREQADAPCAVRGGDTILDLILGPGDGRVLLVE